MNVSSAESIRYNLRRHDLLNLETLTEGEERTRQKMIDSTIFVRVTIAPKTVSEIIRTTKVTFSSQLASLGTV